MTSLASAPHFRTAAAPAQMITSSSQVPVVASMSIPKTARATLCPGLKALKLANRTQTSQSAHVLHSTRQPQTHMLFGLGEGDDKKVSKKTEQAPDEAEMASAQSNGSSKKRTRRDPRQVAKARKPRRRPQIAPLPPPQESINTLKETGLNIKKADFTVSSLMDKVTRNKLDLRPAYQREYVWDNKTASRLIESVLLNVPIPTVFFHEVEGGCLEVVDGKQRLTSIWSFIQEEFPDLQAFKLAGLEVYEELNGKIFSELTEEQQETIKDYAINVHTISRQSQPEFVFEVFERLNMGSIQLNEQELRNCIYQGPYTELLGELASNEHLMSVLGTTAPHLRMRDRELVLRFFAMLRTTPYHFRVPVKTWLNTEIRMNKDLPPDERQELKESFESCIALAWEVFGTEAFRPLKSGKTAVERGEVNVALWDTLMYSFACVDPAAVKERGEEVKAAFYEMIGNDTFRRLSLSQPKAVIARHEKWKHVLEGLGIESDDDDIAE